MEGKVDDDDARCGLNSLKVLFLLEKCEQNSQVPYEEVQVLKVYAFCLYCSRKANPKNVFDLQKEKKFAPQLKVAPSYLSRYPFIFCLSIAIRSFLSMIDFYPTRQFRSFELFLANILLLMGCFIFAAVYFQAHEIHLNFAFS